MVDRKIGHDKPTRTRMLAWAGAALGVLVVLWGWAADNDRKPASEPPPPVRATTVAKADSVIASVKLEPSGVLAVGADLGVGWDAPFYVTAAEIAVRRVGEAMQAGAADAAGARQVEFTFTVPANDRLGKETRAPFMTASFDAADLRAARFDHLVGGRTLDLAVGVKLSGPAARRAILEWCADDDHRAANFCGLALKR